MVCTCDSSRWAASVTVAVSCTFRRRWLWPSPPERAGLHSYKYKYSLWSGVSLELVNSESDNEKVTPDKNEYHRVGWSIPWGKRGFCLWGVGNCQHQVPKLTWHTRHTPLPSPMPWQVISNLVETNRIVGFTLKSFSQRILSLKVKTWPVTMDPHSKQVGAISWILNFSWNHPITLLFELQTVAQLGGCSLYRY